MVLCGPEYLVSEVGITADSRCVVTDLFHPDVDEYAAMILIKPMLGSSTPRALKATDPKWRI
jgi:hypothetical protein